MKKVISLALVVIGLVGVERVEAQSTCFLPSACGTTTFTGGTLTGPLLLPDGTAAAPSLSFSAQSTAGLYRAGNFSVGLSVGAAPGLVLWDTNGVMSLRNNAGGIAIGSLTDTFIYRDAANTLALRNGTNAQAFNIYNTYTDGSNYERGFLQWGTNNFYVGTTQAGTGVARNLVLNPSSAIYFSPGASAVYPITDDAQILGGATLRFKDFYTARSIQGSKSKALTESSATSFTQVAVPQTAGANYAAGEVIYTVYATDGTDSQTLQGRVAFSAVNKAGTETCSIGVAYTEVLSVSTASTLTCTHTCVTGLTDAVQIASNCVSSLTQSTFTIESRLDMPKTNTVTPQ